MKTVSQRLVQVFDDKLACEKGKPKMSLYPSLEDMHVDHMLKAQMDQVRRSSEQPAAPPPYPIHPQSAPMPTSSDESLAALYPTLNEFMGLELSPAVLQAHIPDYTVDVAPCREVAVPAPASIQMIAPLSGASAGLMRAQVSHGVREVVLCKNDKGKVGLRVRAINKGIFVVIVEANSPAAMVRLRFGDQILQINGANVAGYSMDKVHEIFKKTGKNNIRVAVRDRPFERTMTLHKDSSGHIGFQFTNGKIISIVKDSSAARNGLLTEHNLLEVNGQNVVGLKDKEITKLIDEGGQIVTITIMPSFLFDHMMKHMASSLVKQVMDHTIPDL
ncbi:unnamed protein product [Darwinula stevensoni]|uniref:PDZ domain-containing protein n=1 Tax=Darwinula stevensoni TaxID=69355 RepID=A0A7R8XC59_9CRUS|nr:unnamed protein product [Darwinula stevensoni]CAG0887371.1 unnamed protein product [Darwinula stevensoni]